MIMYDIFFSGHCYYYCYYYYLSLIDCNTCPHGTYISKECSTYVDTECSNCVGCGELQFLIQPCVGVQNTICGSCESCFFNDPETRFKCVATTDRYVWWTLDNCCRDYEDNLVSNSSIEYCSCATNLSGVHSINQYLSMEFCQM